MIKQKLPGIYVQPSYRSALSKLDFLFHSIGISVSDAFTECSYAAFHSAPKEFPTSCLEKSNRMCSQFNLEHYVEFWLCQYGVAMSCEYIGVQGGVHDQWNELITHTNQMLGLTFYFFMRLPNIGPQTSMVRHEENSHTCFWMKCGISHCVFWLLVLHYQIDSLKNFQFAILLICLKHSSMSCFYCSVVWCDFHSTWLVPRWCV